MYYIHDKKISQEKIHLGIKTKETPLKLIKKLSIKSRNDNKVVFSSKI